MLALLYTSIKLYCLCMHLLHSGNKTAGNKAYILLGIHYYMHEWDFTCVIPCMHCCVHALNCTFLFPCIHCHMHALKHASSREQCKQCKTLPCPVWTQAQSHMDNGGPSYMWRNAGGVWHTGSLLSAFVLSVTLHLPPGVSSNQYWVEITYCYPPPLPPILSLHK